jgi:hypothetical protein
VRIFKTKWFVRYARRDRIADASLSDAVDRAERGLIDAELGGGLIKQRLAREGQGRSGGFRVLIAFRSEDRSVFLYGFAKNERDNIDGDELATLKDIAAGWLAASDAKLDEAVRQGVLEEVDDEE